MMIFSNNQVFWFRAAVVLVLGHWSIAAAQEEVFLGALSTRAHAVSGDVYLLSSKVIEIRGFTYDGTAPAVYFWADTNSFPSSHGQVLSDGFPSGGCAVAVGDPEVPPSTRVTQRVEFPGDLTIFDFVGGSLSIWCEAFAESFGSLVLPRSLDASQVPSDGPSPECSLTAEARTLQEDYIPAIALTPYGYNCEPMTETFQVRWKVNGDAIDFELLGEIPEDSYMAFGVSGEDYGTAMIGADIVVADIPWNGDGPRARDFHMNSRAACSSAVGVCSDSVSGFTDDVYGISGESDLGLTLVRYSRPLVPSDLSAEGSVDKSISVEYGVETFIAWALGPIDTTSNDPAFHSFGFARDDGTDVKLSFGRDVVDNCPPLITQGAGTPSPTPSSPSVEGSSVPTAIPAGGAPEGAQEGGIDGFTLVNLEGPLAGASFNFKFNQADTRAGGKDTISVVYEAPVTAWVACGISDNGGSMIGSEAVIGLPDTGVVQKYNLNAKAVSGVVAMSDDKQTLIDASVTQQGGSTILKYTKILEEADEIIINLNADNTFLSAWGNSNNLGIHAARASFSLSGEVIETGKIKLWKAHGAMAAIAWGLLSPLAIAASVLRRFFPGESTWFTVHRTLNMMAVLFTIFAFVIAVIAINQETPDGFDAGHFADGHRLYGLVIFILAMLQAIGGGARPHLPKKPEPSDDEKGEPTTAPESKSSARFFWEIGHRAMGLGILLFCWYQVQLGIKSYGNKFNAGETGAGLPVFFAVAGTIGALILGGYALKILSPEKKE